MSSYKVETICIHEAVRVKTFFNSVEQITFLYWSAELSAWYSNGKPFTGQLNYPEENVVYYCINHKIGLFRKSNILHQHNIVIRVVDGEQTSGFQELIYTAPDPVFTLQSFENPS